jgi:hydrogenase maturation protease
LTSSRVCRRGVRDEVMTKLAVIGLGNALAGDEGIGSALAAELEKRHKTDAIAVYDLGTTLFNLVHVLQAINKAVIIDCALMGESPGTIRRFTRAEAKSVKALRHLSLHEGDVFDIIDLTEKLEARAVDVVLVGIEPSNMELGIGLSPALTRRLTEYLELIERELVVMKRDKSDA